MPTLAAASWNMDQQFPLGPAFNTALVGMPGSEGFTIQPFTPAASGLPSLLRIAGGNGNWVMTVDFEIWCAGQLCAKKVAETNGWDKYSQDGYVYNLSFDDVPNRSAIQANQPCELRIQTLTTSIQYTSFGVQLVWATGRPMTGTFGTVILPGYSQRQYGMSCLYMDLTVA